MTQIWNFNAGPGMLPVSVIEQVRSELLDWRGTGISVMEVSHRSPPFIAMAEEIEADLRLLLGIPNGHRVLFLQGGASTQFALIPLNFCLPSRQADYAVWGHWGRKAWSEANVLRSTHRCVALESKITAIPAPASWQFSEQPSYVHYVENETISGIALDTPPPAPAPLICDMSSSILSRPCPVERYGMIYAGAQKNCGPAGITLVIVDARLLEQQAGELPSMLSYRAIAASASMGNTPPTFAFYVVGLVLKWLKQIGGLAAMARRNAQKANLLYRLIDNSSLYSNSIEGAYRSNMNVTFFLPDEALTERFLVRAADNGLMGLKGHRVAGGLRASIYNAMPLAGVETLAAFMREFERTEG